MLREYQQINDNSIPRILLRILQFTKKLSEVVLFHDVCLLSFDQDCTYLEDIKWVKVFKNRPSRICGRQLLQNLN